MHSLRRILVQALRLQIAVTLVLCSLDSANAGTIITAGLPTGSAIINIDGRADGAAAFSGTNADDWYQPFNASSSLLEYTFQPGTYTFRIVNQTDAAVLFPSLTSTQLAEIGGAWTYNSPWATDYLAFDSSAASNPSEHQLFTGAVTDNGVGYASAALAYQEAITKGYYNKIVTGSGRYTGTTATSYTFGTAETLIFSVPDYYLADNNGVVSVLVMVDTDGDGIPDALDNCPYTANPDQKDSGGINTTVPDGIGDACQCGDVNNDGIVNLTDKTILSRSLASLGPYGSVAAMPGVTKCDVNGDGPVTLRIRQSSRGPSLALRLASSRSAPPRFRTEVGGGEIPFLNQRGGAKRT